MSEVAMELDHVHKTIGKKEIIKDLTFSIQKGEVFGLIGPNGAGKTTTIRMMVGLMKLTKGDIRIFGKSIQTDYKDAVREVGAIVENPEMYPYLSGWQNLLHYARMIPGISRKRVEEMVQLVGLEKPIKQRVSKYSLGMRQRLGIAQALLHNPSVLILDEPTNGLDPAGIKEIRQYIRKLATEENVSIIVSSHLLSEIELMCDRIGIIQNGSLVDIQNVRTTGKYDETDVQEVIADVANIDQAIDLLQTTFEIEAQRENDIISFHTKKNNIPQIIQTFVQHNIAVYQIAVKQSTLEDKFLTMIGENIID